jgi:hypothetical protein
MSGDIGRRPELGQRDRITFRRVLTTGMRALIELDFASGRTVTGMIIRPGALVREYIIGGQRDRYANPIKFAFLASTLYVVLNQLTNRSDVAAFLDPLQSYQSFWPYVFLVTLLPAAALQRLLFRGADFTVAECFTFALYLFGELALVACVLLLAQRYAGLAMPVWPYLVMAGAYTSWAITGLYSDRRFNVWLRGAAVFVFALGIVALLFYAVQWYRFAGLSVA